MASCLIVRTTRYWWAGRDSSSKGATTNCDRNACGLRSHSVVLHKLRYFLPLTEMLLPPLYRSRLPVEQVSRRYLPTIPAPSIGHPTISRFYTFRIAPLTVRTTSAPTPSPHTIPKRLFESIVLHSPFSIHHGTSKRSFFIPRLSITHSMTRL